MTTPHEADLINKDRLHMARMMEEKLTEMGIEVRGGHMTGDSSYPHEITLTYGDIFAIGPTIDLALLAFVEKLLRKQPEPSAIEAALQHLTGNILSMPTSPLAIKDNVNTIAENTGTEID